MSAAAVDVVIPVYNGAATVESAIASIQAQTLRDIRIFVVNDGSTDGSADIVSRLAVADSRVILINRPNGGIVDALNDGLAAGDAPIVARHDADDLASPDRFARQLAFLDSHPDCVAVSGAIRQIDEAGRVLGPIVHMNAPELADPYEFPQREPYLVHPFLMLRRTAIQRVGGYRYVFHAEDTDLYWRLQELGGLANMPDLLGQYRMHTQSITSASILNGRIAAMNSQLSGLSAIRRRTGRPDLVFRKAALAEYQQARSLREIVRLGSRGLEPDEVTRLTAATAAKLLELAAYRPYELDGEDCATIREAIRRTLPQMSPDSRQFCTSVLSGTAARVAAKGQILAGLRLAPRGQYLRTGLRFGMRLLLPPKLRRRLREARGKTGYVK